MNARPAPDHAPPRRALRVLVRWQDTILDAVQLAHEGRAPLAGGGLVHVASLASASAALDLGGEAVIVPAGAKTELSRGPLTYVAEWVDPAAALGHRGVSDWTLPWMFSVSGLLHAWFVGAAWVTPPADPIADMLARRRPTLITEVLLREAPKPPKKKLEGVKSGAKAKDREGATGRKDTPRREAARSKKAGAPLVDASKRRLDRELVARTGLIGVINDLRGRSAASTVLGAGGLGRGINDAMGGLRGAKLGDAGGAGGLGVRGFGPGGGGDAIGIGGLATHGGGPGGGGGGDIQLAKGDKCRGCGEVRPGGKTILVGGLSREEIGRVIRRNLPRFKYCYERQLATTPELAGKIAVSFTIDPTGRVVDASVKESTLDSSEVAHCVLEAMKSLEFPKPKGGGVVMVTYPFLFAST